MHKKKKVSHFAHNDKKTFSLKSLFLATHKTSIKSFAKFLTAFACVQNDVKPPNCHFKKTFLTPEGGIFCETKDKFSLTHFTVCRLYALVQTFFKATHFSSIQENLLKN